jgi:glycosyltransferase involved in cell wall biosynthesis
MALNNVQKKQSLSIVVPIYNEEACLPELLRRLLGLHESLVRYETSFVFVNDGSTDTGGNLLEDFGNQHEFVKVVSLSRNFGHQIAMTAGLDCVDADFVAILDSDLQDPPELIPAMLQKASEGYDIVYGKRLERKGESIFKRLTAHIFYRLINMLTDVPIPVESGDFRLISRKVLLALRSMPERHRFIRGMIPWIGFKSVPVLYERDKRFAGHTKYPFRKMLDFALDAILSFSNKPLRVVSLFGLVLVFLGLIGGAIVLYTKFFTNLNLPGVTSIFCTLVILGGFQICFLGIIGEYIGRIFEESKKRPLYIIDKILNGTKS